MRHWLSKLVLLVTLAAVLAANVVGPRMANAVAHGGTGATAGVAAVTTDPAVADDGAHASAAVPCHGPSGAADPATAVPDHGCCVAACAALGFPPAAAVPAGPPAVTARPSVLAPVLVPAAPALLDRPPRHV